MINNKEGNNNSPNKTTEEHKLIIAKNVDRKITYDQAKENAAALYLNDNTIVDVLEEDRGFIIVVKSKDNDEIMYKFLLDKKVDCIQILPMILQLLMKKVLAVDNII